VRICYLDESGVPELGAGTSHFILLGLSIPAEKWRIKDAEITLIKRRFGLEQAEVHTGWMSRRYLEQERIPGFEQMGAAERRSAVERERLAFLVKKATRYGEKSIKEDRKNFRKTKPYIHLTLAERRDVLHQIAERVSRWDDCVIFGECTDKRTFAGKLPRTPPFEEAFTQILTRFHRFLENLPTPEFGFFVQDKNENMASRLTELMRLYHQRGTRWGDLPLFVETPLFVDSSLTSMVQVVDVCAYATRRFCENGETELFDFVYSRINLAGGRLVGMRHYTNRDEVYGRRCNCRICQNH